MPEATAGEAGKSLAWEQSVCRTCQAVSRNTDHTTPATGSQPDALLLREQLIETPLMRRQTISVGGGWNIDIVLHEHPVAITGNPDPVMLQNIRAQ